MKADYKIDYKYNWKEYLGYLKKYKLWVFLALVVVIIHEAKQVLDKYLFKIILDRGTDYTAGILTLNAFIHIAIIIAWVFIFGTLVSFACNWLKLHFVNRIELAAIFDLKQKYFTHIINLDHNFHTTHKTGSLISRFSRSGNALERLTDTLIFDMAPLFFQTIFAIGVLIYLDKIQALVIFGVMVVFILFSYSMQRESEKSNIEANKSEDIEKGNMADFFTNVDSIRYFGKEKLIRARFKALTEKTRISFLKNWDFYRFTSAVQSIILGIGTFLLIFFSIRDLIDGKITLGTLGFVYTAYYSLIGPMFGFVHGIRNISRSMADFQELFEYGKVKSSIEDKPSAENLVIKKGEVEFKDISFNYGKRKIFTNFSLSIPKNKKIALVGHSGSGKTTLVKLLYRLYDVNNGSILIDGKDIREVKQESLRSEMSIVPQECVLFDDSIYNNISFSNPSASREEIIGAIKFAQLDKIIDKFPNKENTIVGERGVKLSGGEKQRVSIARAILANKRVLVLDEATSSLDSATEYEIQKDLAKLMENRTSIIIAHRLSTIMHADTIVVLKEGKIVQMGKHHQLIQKPGEYKKLWNLQRGGYIK